MCVCACVRASIKISFNGACHHQEAVIHTYGQRNTHIYCSQVRPLHSCPPRKLLHIHIRYSFTITCHSVPHSESPLQQCSSVNSPYYITIHMHAQTQTAAEQCRSIHAHTNTPYCILNLNFDTHLKREPLCVCVCILRLALISDLLK